MKKLMTFLLVTLLSGAVYAQQNSSKRAYLGVMATEVGDALISHLKLDKKKSFIIQRVVKDTPASSAGLEKYDIILKINSEEVDSTKPLSHFLGQFQPEDKINLDIMRSGEMLNLDVVLGETVPRMSLADMKNSIKLIMPEKDKKNIEIQILENMEQLKEFQKDIQVLLNIKDKNGEINEEMQKALEMIAKANKDTNHFKFNSTMSTVMSTSDTEHNVVITMKDGMKKATVRDNTGKIIFEGDINTDAEIELIPEEIREKVKNVEKKILSIPRKAH